MNWLIAGCATAVVIVAVSRAFRRRSHQRELMLLCHRAGLAFAPVDPFPDTVWLPFCWLGGERVERGVAWGLQERITARGPGRPSMPRSSW